MGFMDDYEAELLAKARAEIATERADPLYLQKFEARKKQREDEEARMRANGAIDEGTDEEEEDEE